MGVLSLQLPGFPGHGRDAILQARVPDTPQGLMVRINKSLHRFVAYWGGGCVTVCTGWGGVC